MENMWDFITYISGASLTAAKALITMQYRFSINWCGGWHHALRLYILSLIIENNLYMTMFNFFSLEIQLKVFVM